MKNDARKLSAEEQYLIRKLAVQRVFDGEVSAKVARSFGLGDRTIYRWLKIAREEGIESLSPKAKTGRNRMLSDIEEQEVKHWIIGGDPRQYGFDFGLWTRQIVSKKPRQSAFSSSCFLHCNRKITRCTPNYLMSKALDEFGDLLLII